MADESNNTENPNGGTAASGANAEGAQPPQSTPSQPAGAADAEPRSAQPEDPLEAAQADLARVRDQLLRTAADFDNYRKRARREAQDLERRARDEFLRDLLPVFDNLERAAAHAGSASDVKAVADGIGLVMRQFQDTLGKLGVERIAAVGEAFDPAVHEAIQQFETTEQPPGTITAEVQAGYRAGDRLVRPAMVVVAKAPPNSEPNA